MLKVKRPPDFSGSRGVDYRPMNGAAYLLALLYSATSPTIGREGIKWVRPDAKGRIGRGNHAPEFPVGNS